MFDLFLVGQSLGVIDVYFEEEAQRQDFWTPSENMLKMVKDDGRWSMINPEKLKENYRKSIVQHLLLFTRGSPQFFNLTLSKTLIYVAN